MSNMSEKLVGKSDEIFLTQYAFDLKVEELKTATNPTSTAKKITVHVYSNDLHTLVDSAKTIFDDANLRFNDVETEDN